MREIPVAPGGGGAQPWWNPQQPSGMPTTRYARSGAGSSAGSRERHWPDRVPDRAPLWASVDLRDGNQALPSPMDTVRKASMFDLLVQMGFKEIEVGYPAASEADFAFVRDLVTRDRIPDDVTISVSHAARMDLIDRTFESIRGVDRAMVHLCLATACLWRNVVLSMTSAQLQGLTVRAAEHMVRLAEATCGVAAAFPVLTRDVQRHRAGVRSGGVRCGDYHLGCLTGPPGDRQSADDRGDRLPQRLCRPGRMDAPQLEQSGFSDLVGAPPQ